MTDQEYINIKALGTITAAINTLKDLCPENLKDTIKEGENKKVLGTLYNWQERLFKKRFNESQYFKLIEEKNKIANENLDMIQREFNKIPRIIEINKRLKELLIIK